jgi:hypothetical protein
MCVVDCNQQAIALADCTPGGWSATEKLLSLHGEYVPKVRFCAHAPDPPP